MINRVIIGAAEVREQNKVTDHGNFKPTYEQLESYDYLFGFLPDSQNDYNGNLNDTLYIIREVIKRYNWQVKKLADHLKGKSLEQSAFNIWHFCVNNIKYKNDRYGYEEIRTPARTWKERHTGVDCDDFAIFTASLLIQMGYVPQCVVVGFFGKDYGHIYTTVGASLAQPPYNNDVYNGGAVKGGVVVDPVMNTVFNKHPKGITKALIMNMEPKIIIAGLGALPQGKITLAVDTFRDTFTENYNRPSDVILRLQIDGKAIPLENIKRGSVIKITNAPDTTAQNLRNMNGFHLVEDSANHADGIVSYIYLTTGRATWKGTENILNGADFVIMPGNGNPPYKNITGWQKDAATADKWMNQAAGKIDNCRRIYNWIKKDIAPDISVIKETQHLTDFNNIVGDLEFWYWYAEAAYNQCDGLKNTNNPFYSTQKHLQKISDIYKMAAGRMLAAEEDFLKKEARIKDWMKVTKFEKLVQAAKTVAFAPIRAIVEACIHVNLFGTATALALEKQRKPGQYEQTKNTWRDMGGDRTKFENAVADGATKPAKLAGKNLGEEEADQKYVKLPVGVGTTAATFISASLGPEVAPFAVPAGVVVDGLCKAVNAAKIPLKKDEPNVTDPGAENFDFNFPDYKGDGGEEGGSNKALIFGGFGLATLIVLMAGNNNNKNK